MTVIWSIAGSDPLACSGIQIDIRAAHSQNVHCCTLITCTTAQNHTSCKSIDCLGADKILDQFHSLKEQEEPSAVKIGMIASEEALKAVVAIAKDLSCPVIYDPVLGTSSGAFNLGNESLHLIKELLSQVSLVTPNLDEASKIVAYPLENADHIRQAAKDIKSMGAKAVLIKGGHQEGDEDCTDYYSDENRSVWLSSSRLDQDYRGTGCYLSTAIACSAAKGMTMREAVIDGRMHLMEAMESSYSLGNKEVLHEVKIPSHRPHVSPEQQAFPDMGSQAIGFYPVVPNVQWLKRLLPLGVTTAQLRIKGMNGDQLLSEVKEAIALAKQYKCRLFINDYWQMAIEHGAYGVHLGQEDLDDADTDAILKAGLRLGISTHSPEELGRANDYKPSYVALGPIFETTCKSMAFGPQGIERVGEWVKMTDYPLVAIGGLKPEHGPDIIRQGASGCALISDVLEADDPEARAKEWIHVMGN